MTIQKMVMQLRELKSLSEKEILTAEEVKKKEALAKKLKKYIKPPETEAARQMWEYIAEELGADAAKLALLNA